MSYMQVLSNTFGSRPVTLGAITVGLQSTGGNLLAGKVQPVLFSGKPDAVIPVGEELYSDEVALDIDPADPLLEDRNLAVSFFVKGGQWSPHLACRCVLHLLPEPTEQR